MTVLGKIMVFFVLILSLVWNGLTVNAYVTRTNWAEVAKKQDANRKVAEENSGYQRKLGEQYRDTGNARILALQQQVAGLQVANDTLAKEAALTKDQLNKKLVEEQAAIPREDLLRNDIKKLELQVDSLQKRLSEVELEANLAIVSGEKAKGDAVKARLSESAALGRADATEQSLLKANDELNDLRNGRTRGQGVGGARVLPPEGFKANVTRVDADQVEIDLGGNAKLLAGAQLNVFRTKPNGKFLGYLTVTKVDPFSAVGRFSPPPGVLKPGADDLPQKGDLVGVIK